MERLDLITIGETLIELSSSEKIQNSDIFYKYYGGDALTTSIAALRAGSKVGFISKIGKDFFGDFIESHLLNEGLDISNVKMIDGLNGLYFISCKEGQKELAYYRRKTAAMSLSEEDIDEEYIKSAKIIYATGITQSLSPSARSAVLKAFRIAKENNVKVAYDFNYDSLIWSKEQAIEAYEEIKEYIDYIFMNIRSDSQALFGIDSYEKLIQHYADCGASVVILKSQSNKGYYVGYNGEIMFTSFYSDVKIDSTGAGDAFNGAFLHDLADGKSPFEAVETACVTSGLQVRGVGAIKSIPFAKDVQDAIREKNGIQ